MKIFYIRSVQESKKYNNTVIIQGYINERMMEGAKIKAFINFRGKKERLSVKYEVRKLSPTLWAEYEGRVYSYLVLFFVNVKDYLNEDKGDIEILFYNPDKTGTEDPVSIYKSSISSFKSTIAKSFYCVDSVEVSDNTVKISGWAAGADKIKVYEVIKKTPNPIECEIKRSQRFDAQDVLEEYDGKEEIGFNIKAETDAKTILLRLNDKNKTVIRINLSDYIQNNSPVSMVRRYSWRLSENLKTIGVWGTTKKVFKKLLPKKSYNGISYDKWRIEMAPKDRELDRQRNDTDIVGPKFTILVPLYKTPKNMLSELIESIKAQTYSNYEVILSDGSPEDSRIESMVKSLIKGDERFIYVSEPNAGMAGGTSVGYDIERREDGSLSISDNTNQALTYATGDYIALGDHDDLLTPDALYECACVLRDGKMAGVDSSIEGEDNSRLIAIYSDEDKVDESGKSFFDPHFKPDFNKDLLRSVNYICHLFVASKELVNKVGGFRREFDGAQDYDFILRCTEQAEKIYHIPKVLYHWRASAASTATNPEAKMYAFEAGKKAIEEQYKRLGIEAEVEYGENLGYYNTRYKVQGSPLVSIIIPNKDHIYDLKKCIESIDNKSTYKNIEYIIVENNSVEEKTFEYYDSLKSREDIKVVKWDGIFNYSAINNLGVRESSGEYILLLNNDIELDAPDSIETMLGICQREDVGAVGARLYYDDGTLQHAGVIIGIGGVAGHAFQRQSEAAGSVYFNRSKMIADFSAVTAACLMIKRSVYDEVDGLDEGFKVAFNDIDFCLRILDTGRLIVYNPLATLYHYESKSRGYEDSIDKQDRFRGEISRFRGRWGQFLDAGDPYYNPNLTLDRQDFSLKYV